MTTIFFFHLARCLQPQAEAQDRLRPRKGPEDTGGCRLQGWRRDRDLKLLAWLERQELWQDVRDPAGRPAAGRFQSQDQSNGRGCLSADPQRGQPGVFMRTRGLRPTPTRTSTSSSTPRSGAPIARST